MTNLALPNKDDYPGAAKKHLNDAGALITARRFDGAGYLTGYVVECSLRSVVMVGHLARLGRIGHDRLKTEFASNSSTMKRFKSEAARTARGVGRDHDLDELAKATTEYANELNAHNASYAPPINKKTPPFGAWTHKMRYHAEGETSEPDARAWLDEAEKIYVMTIGAMLRDGVIRR